MKRNIYKLISLAVLALLPVSLSAQALPFVAADYNPVSLAKGGTSLMETSSVAYSSFGNAATVPFSKNTADFGVGYTMWTPDGVSSDILYIGGAYNVKGKFGVSAGLTYGMSGAYDIFDENGAAKGQFKPLELQFNAGFAYRFLPYLSAGVNIGYASTSLAEGYSYSSIVADVYVMSVLENGLKATIGVSDLGNGVLSSSGQKFSLPTAGTAGVGYEKEFTAMHKISAQAEAEYYFSGVFAAAVGAEYIFNDLLALRAGYRYGGESIIPSFFSIGAGVHFAGISLDVAYLISGSPIGNTLGLSLRYSL